MSEMITSVTSTEPDKALSARPGSRIRVEEIARRLSIGRQTVYVMLDRGIVPAIRLGQRWLITRCAYEEWERRCGTCNRSVADVDFRPTQR